MRISPIVNNINSNNYNNINNKKNPSFGAKFVISSAPLFWTDYPVDETNIRKHFKKVVPKKSMNDFIRTMYKIEDFCEKKLPNTDKISFAPWSFGRVKVVAESQKADKKMVADFFRPDSYRGREQMFEEIKGTIERATAFMEP